MAESLGYDVKQMIINMGSSVSKANIALMLRQEILMQYAKSISGVSQPTTGNKYSFVAYSRGELQSTVTNDGGSSKVNNNTASSLTTAEKIKKQLISSLEKQALNNPGDKEELEMHLEFLKDKLEGPGNAGYQNSTKDFLISQEGIWRTVVQSGNTYSIGYGMDFTKSSHPDLYQKYVVNGESITDEDAYKLLDPKINSKIQTFIDEIGTFIDSNNLSMNQNQYDALYSYFYNNGAYVFSDTAYKSWVEKGGEYKLRAEARLELKNYLISANGAYNDDTILDLFLNTKGPSIKYEYISRRTNEASLFSK